MYFRFLSYNAFEMKNVDGTIVLTVLEDLLHSVAMDETSVHQGMLANRISDENLIAKLWLTKQNSRLI